MAYDVHIVRSDNWLNSESRPIPKIDVDKLISDDSELDWSRVDFSDMLNEAGVIARYYAILWHGEPTFMWYKSRIKCTDPSHDEIRKMVVMAGKLGAKVFGDEDEQYVLVKTDDGEVLRTRG
ncbi:MAG: hypothetical protein ACLQVD_20330 [Capsulimonadaceae bacterium]